MVWYQLSIITNIRRDSKNYQVEEGPGGLSGGRYQVSSGIILEGTVSGNGLNGTRYQVVQYQIWYLGVCSMEQYQVLGGCPGYYMGWYQEQNKTKLGVVLVSGGT